MNPKRIDVIDSDERRFFSMTNLSIKNGGWMLNVIRQGKAIEMRDLLEGQQCNNIDDMRSIP